jgi:hypothetical protein
MKVLFLSHYHKDVKEIRQLATELRLHGIIPWVDKDGGFNLGDNNEDKARKVIQEESFGLILYATGNVFDRPFIKKVEIQTAKAMKKQDSQFLLVAIPRSIDFASLEKLSKKHFHFDLSNFHSIEIPDGIEIKPKFGEISRHILSIFLKKSAHQIKGSFSMQVCTREMLPDEKDDTLCVDARQLFLTEDGLQQNWPHFLQGLSDIKKEIASQYGRPRLKIHGSKHLTAAFLVGRVFSPFQLAIKQGDDLWMSDGHCQSSSCQIETLKGHKDSSDLSIEVSITKRVSSGVDRTISPKFRPCNRIQCAINENLIKIDGPVCRDIVQKITSKITNTVGVMDIKTIHIFAAVPQGLMIMLGREFGALPPVQLYEYDGNRYLPSILVPSGAL